MIVLIIITFSTRKERKNSHLRSALWVSEVAASAVRWRSRALTSLLGSSGAVAVRPEFVETVFWIRKTTILISRSSPIEKSCILPAVVCLESRCELVTERISEVFSFRAGGLGRPATNLRNSAGGQRNRRRTFPNDRQRT